MTSIPFEDSFAATTELSSRTIARFLRVAGWEMTREKSGVMSVWQSTFAKASLMLPQDETFDDYRPRLNEALATISRIHHVQGQALALEIASASSDILLLRADQHITDGSIPLREAEALLLGARKMLTAAALSAVSPKANFGPARPAAVKDFIADDVRMGHTLHGSFVITILARLDDEDEAADAPSETRVPVTEPPAGGAEADPIELSFNRRVMTTLATGLSAASAVLSPGSAEDLDAAVQRGVSAQLLDSITEMSGFEGVRSIGTTFKWSPSHTAPPSDVPETVVLPNVTKQRAEQVRERLKRRPALVADQIIGPVVKLERSADDTEGIAVVDGFAGKERKRVRLRLAPAAYALATAAHEQREAVVAEGTITFESGSYWIKSPTRLEEVRKMAPSPQLPSLGAPPASPG